MDGWMDVHRASRAESEQDAFEEAVSRAFEEMTATYDEFLVRDVLNCFAKVTTAAVVNQVVVFFKCTDADGSGTPRVCMTCRARTPSDRCGAGRVTGSA